MVLDRPSPQAAGVVFYQQDPDILKVKKVDFVAFIAMVINGTAMVERRSRKIEIIVDAAERFLGLKHFSVKESHGTLNSTHKTPVSTSEVKRQLRDAGFLGRVAMIKPYLRLANKNKILRWAK